MATTTIYVKLGNPRMGGGKTVSEGTAAANDVLVTVNTATVLLKSDLVRVMEYVQDRLSGGLK